MAAALAAITATLALAWFIIAATPAPAHADALCDAMRARFGPGYPCISVPTNTFTPTAPAGPTTTNPTGSSSGGPQVGIDTGPGPGVGNGTPIVPVPGAPTNAAPGSTAAAPAATPTTAQIPTRPPQSAQPAPSTTQRPPAAPSRSTDPSPTPTPAPAGTTDPVQKASIPTTDDTPSDQTTQMLWLLGGAAAIVAGASTARSGGVGRYLAAATANGYPTITSALRSWLPGGGSERARIGNSQYVLINDPTSPREYVFHENVPPGGHMSVNPDGTATIYNRDGRPVGTIAKPWAYDSLGRPQRTWYTVDNNGNLVQHIDPNPDAVYPILADPPDPTARLKQAQQQQAAAAQGHPAHQPGTGTPLNKSPNADPPPPPPATPPPANKPDYGGDPHSQAGTHSGLPAQSTASGPDLVQQTPAPTTTPSDDPGLRNALTAPITTPSQPETSPTQGPQPAPGQNLPYTDFLNNQLGGQTVGTIQQRPGPNNTTQYFRTNPDGTENTVTAANTTPNGELIYTFNDGTTQRADPTARYRQAQEYIYKEMTTNRNSTYFHIMAASHGASPVEYLMFLLKVQSHSDWDHKQKLESMFGLQTSDDYYFPVPGTSSSVYYDIYSNIHYGYIGNEAGIPPSILIDAANGGFSSTGVNDGGDDIAMKAGIELSEKFGKDLTQQQLNDQVAKVVNDIRDAQIKGDPTTQVRPQ